MHASASTLQCGALISIKVVPSQNAHCRFALSRHVVYPPHLLLSSTTVNCRSRRSRSEEYVSQLVGTNVNQHANTATPPPLSHQYGLHRVCEVRIVAHSHFLECAEYAAFCHSSQCKRTDALKMYRWGGQVLFFFPNYCVSSVSTNSSDAHRLLQQMRSGCERKVLSATSTGTIVAHMRAACCGRQFPGRKS